MSSTTTRSHAPGRVRRFAARVAWVLLGSGVIGSAVLAAFVAYTWDRQWDAPLPDIHANRDPEVIRRGEYLVFGPALLGMPHQAD